MKSKKREEKVNQWWDSLPTNKKAYLLCQYNIKTINSGTKDLMYKMELEKPEKPEDMIPLPEEFYSMSRKEQEQFLTKIYQTIVEQENYIFQLLAKVRGGNLIKKGN